jgi:hypothetical protein
VSEFTKWGNWRFLASLTGAVVILLVWGAGAAQAIQGTATISVPAPHAELRGSVTVRGTAIADDFQFYKLEFGPGDSPPRWSVIGGLHNIRVTNGTLGTWDVGALPPGAYTLKLTVVDNTGNFLESTVPVTVSPASPSEQASSGGPACSAPPDSLMLVPVAVRAGAAAPGSPPDRGIVRGQIRDASGRGLCGLVVRVTRSGFQRTAVTENEGKYEIANLEPGVYDVTVERQLCSPAAGLTLPAGQALQIDFVELRPLSATVSPTATGSPRPSPTATPQPTSTPAPPAQPLSPTAIPRLGPAAPLDPGGWWEDLGTNVDPGELTSYLYLGVLGGVLVFAGGVVVALLRGSRSADSESGRTSQHRTR